MSIFETKAEMPPKDNSPDVVRTALSMSEMHRNYLPAAVPTEKASVQNLAPKLRGCHY